MTECLPRYIRFTWLVDDYHWQGADRPDGPWRPIPAPQSGLLLMTDGPAVPESGEPASVVEEPSDEELLELAQSHCISYAFYDGTMVSPYQEDTDMRSEVLSFARAVLARWGQP